MLQRLQQVTAALAHADTEYGIADALISEVLPALGADGGVLALVNGDTLDILRADGYGAVADQWPTMPLDRELPLATTARTGAPVWLASAAERVEQFPETAPLAKLHTIHEPGRR